MKIESFTCPCCGAPAKIGIGNCEYCGAFNTLLTDDERANINNSLQASIKKISKNLSKKEYENERSKKIIESNLSIKEKLDLLDSNFSNFAGNLMWLSNSFTVKKGKLVNPDFVSDANTFINDTYKYTLDEIEKIVTKAYDGEYGPLNSELKSTVNRCNSFIKTIKLYLPLIELTNYDSDDYQKLDVSKKNELKQSIKSFIDYHYYGDELSYDDKDFNAEQRYLDDCKVTMENFFHEYYYDYDYKCLTSNEIFRKKEFEYRNNIGQLSKEIEKLGMLQFSRKKELKEQLKELEKNYNNLEINSKITKLEEKKANYENDYKELERDKKPLVIAAKKELDETAFTAFKIRSKLKEKYSDLKSSYDNKLRYNREDIKRIDKEIEKLQKELM